MPCILTQTLARIELLNQDEPFRPHGINQFADLTQEEFRAQYLMDPVLFAEARKQQAQKEVGRECSLLLMRVAHLPCTADRPPHQHAHRPAHHLRLAQQQRDRRHPRQEPGPVRKVCAPGACSQALACSLTCLVLLCSCWAFSATENIESVWALAGNKLVELAPQQIVDCDKTDDGCNGGDTPTAFDYVVKAGGLELETVCNCEQFSLTFLILCRSRL